MREIDAGDVLRPPRPQLSDCGGRRGSCAVVPARKKAIVAVARHLAVDLWRLHTGQCSAQQLGFKL